MEEDNIVIYTDGSCHSQAMIGGWAALILLGKEKILIDGKELDTTHNRMELLSVIRSIEYLINNSFTHNPVTIITDSQYVAGILERKEKLKQADYLTKKGTSVQNEDLVSHLISYLDKYPINFVKVKAHQKVAETENFNRLVDKHCRKIVRQAVKDQS